MTIQWFPGHMTKARRQVVEKLKLVDIIFELVDSRIPYSSSNPMLNEIIKNKPKLVLLNKSDIADSKVTAMWEKFYEEKNIPSVRINSIKGTGVDKITAKAKEVLKEKLEKEKRKGLKPRAVRAMILGIPNVGKSTLINKLAKRKATQTGDRPGVTKAQQWIKVGKELELLDTPGILWPKFDDQEVGFKLAVTGAIKDTILPIDDVVLYAIEYLKNNYSEEFKERYNLSSLEDNFQILDDIGKVRGCLRSGGVVDYDRVYEIFLHDLRGNRIGNVSLETPEVIIKNKE